MADTRTALDTAPAAPFNGLVCPLPLSVHKNVVLGHGSGGKLTSQLIQGVFLPAFGNSILNRLDDQAVVSISAERLAFTTDSFVVTPLFFPGGDIGKLAVNGTVNDLAMSGARPLFLAAAFILEEGLPMEELERVVDSMRVAAAEAGVQIVAGDTKVVNRGQADKLFITTTGMGTIENGISISAAAAKPGDKILVSGFVGDHGIAILSQRENLDFEGAISSDTAPLNGLVSAMLTVADGSSGQMKRVSGVHSLRDATRGGIATVLHEIGDSSGMGMLLDEQSIPVRDSVRGACEILGLDPLYVANEGKLVAAVAPEMADEMLRRMRSHPLGRDAAIIGEVVAEHPGLVLMKSAVGGTRILDTLFGEQLPRIC